MICHHSARRTVRPLRGVRVVVVVGLSGEVEEDGGVENLEKGEREGRYDLEGVRVMIDATEK